MDCIYEDPRPLYIHPDECIDCGACEDACPTSAIVAEWSLPDERPLVRAQELFARVGSPNGAERHGPLGEDHPEAAAMPAGAA